MPDGQQAINSAMHPPSGAMEALNIGKVGLMCGRSIQPPPAQSLATRGRLCCSNTLIKAPG